jgi:hypothetical protein
MSYNLCRYLIPAYLYASKIPSISSSQKQFYLNQVDKQFKYIFDTSSCYKDVGLNIMSADNMLHDNYLGWYNCMYTPYFNISDSICQDKWLLVKICINNVIKFSPIGIRVRVWVNDTSGLPLYNETLSRNWTLNGTAVIYGSHFDCGTVALLSGWSDVDYDSLKIWNIHDTFLGNEIYDSYARRHSFRSDWAFVGDSLNSGMTADWSNWSIDTTSGMISCNAATDNRRDSINIFGHPPDGSRMHGKYAALIIRNTAIPEDSLQDIQISFKMRISKRNIGMSESGVAFRWHNPVGADSLGHIVDQTDSNCSINGFSYFRPSAVSINAKFRPHNIIHVTKNAYTQVHYNCIGESYYTPLWNYAPWDQLLISPFNGLGYADDGITYDCLVFSALGRYFECDSSHASSYFAHANDEHGVISKWKSVWQRNTDGWNYGCGLSRGYHAFGGWDKAVFPTSFVGRVGQMFSMLFRYDKGTNQDFYLSNYIAMCSELSTNLLWLDELGSFQWTDERDYIGYMCDHKNRHSSPADISHHGEVVEYLLMAHEDSTYTNITFHHMISLAKTFTNRIWNRNIYSPLIAAYNDGTDFTDSSLTLSEWSLLSRYDFKVWEILDSFFGLHEEYIVGDDLTCLGRISAEMLYNVKYGIPRNLLCDTITFRCSDPDNNHDTAYILRWDPPSDYACGYERLGKRFPGSRLKYYNIYRRIPEDTSWTCLDSINIRSFQNANMRPWYYDHTAIAGMTYDYCVRTQDWSVGISNISDPSNIFTIHYPDSTTSSLPKTPTGIPLILPLQLAWSKSIDSLKRAIYFVSSVLEIPENDTLVILPGSTLCFSDSTEIECFGRIIAHGGASCDSTIFFIGAKNIPGYWWGVSLFPKSWHSFKYCCFSDGVNNLVLHDSCGLIESCDISNAASTGIQINNGIDGQIVRNSFIHDNCGSNIVLWGYTDVDGNTVDIFALIDGCTISKALHGDGIACGIGASPFIRDCEIMFSHRFGLCLDPGSIYGVRVLHCNIHDNLAGIYSINGSVYLEHSSLIDNFNGIDLHTSSLLGYTASNDEGNNILRNVSVNLAINDESYVLFGEYLKGYYVGAKNCFYIDTSAFSPAFQIKCTGGYGFLEYNGYDPDSSQAPALFETCSIAVSPSWYCLSDVQISPSYTNDDIYDELTNIWHSLDTSEYRLSIDNMLVSIRASLCNSAKYHALALLSRMSQMKKGAVFMYILDSLSENWTGYDKVLAQQQRMPYLIRNAYWQEARRVIQFLRDSSTLSEEYLNTMNNYIDAHDSATRDRWLSRRFHGFDSDYFGNTWYCYETPRASKLYKLAKKKSELDKAIPDENSLLVYPNPAHGDLLIIEIRSVSTERKCLIMLHDILGRLIAKREVLDITRYPVVTDMSISGCSNGIYLLTVFTETGLLSRIVEIDK